MEKNDWEDENNGEAEGEGESSNHDAFRSSFGISSDGFDF